MSSEAHNPLQGMTDLCAPEIHLWQQMERTAARVFARYGFLEVRTPLLERTDLFCRSLGDTTDIVSKEMYSFEDAGGRQVTLRPEGTASVLRFVAAQGAAAGGGRYYYLGPMFRRERPQAGRKRQFHQVGAEALGAPAPTADAECIALQVRLLAEFGLKDLVVQVNTRGTPEDGARVADGLRAALQPHLADLGEDDRRRHALNVMRILDSKDPATQAVVDRLPPVTDFMSAEARAYFQAVCEQLAGLGVKHEANPRLVRGLDYYVHTVWEITHGALGAQNAISAGGRYRMEFGGRAVEGVGFAAGMERMVTALQAAGVTAVDPAQPKVWMVGLDAPAQVELLVLAQELRVAGAACGLDTHGRSAKAQMREAHRAGAPWVVLRGGDERARDVFVLKNMADGTQREAGRAAIIEQFAPA